MDDTRASQDKSSEMVMKSEVTGAAGADQEHNAAAGASDILSEYREYQLKVLSAAHANIDALFEYAHDAIRAQSITELIGLSADHSRRHLEMMSKHGGGIAAATQKLLAEAAKRS